MVRSKVSSNESNLLFIWGNGSHGRLGQGAYYFGLKGDVKDRDEPIMLPLNGHEVGWKKVSCGSWHTVALSKNGDVLSWGGCDDGQLGQGDKKVLYSPKVIESFDGITIIDIACGSFHTAAVAKNGDLYTWGLGKYGVLGHDEIDRTVPSKVEALADEDVVQVTCGTHHTVALTAKGTTFSWGKNAYGRTGHGYIKGIQETPKIIRSLKLKKVVFVSAGTYHTACVTNDGFAFTWGEGEFGRLGHGDEKNYSKPEPVETLFDVKVKEINCGVYHTAVCTMDGKMYTFGRGDRGQLGHGDRENKLSPTPVGALAEKFVIQVQCGLGHTMALTPTGSVYTWGCGTNGKLGHGIRKDHAVPRLVERLKPHKGVQLATFNSHSAVLINPVPTSSESSCTIS